MKQKPTDFDWVSAQHACSAQAKFADLLVSVKRDLEQAKETRGLRFAVDEQGDDHLWIGRDSRDGDGAVRFYLRGDSIGVDLIQWDGTSSFAAKVTLNEFGECLFVIDGVEFTSWELRRKALEKLFFSPNRER